MVCWPAANEPSVQALDDPPKRSHGAPFSVRHGDESGGSSKWNLTGPVLAGSLLRNTHTWPDSDAPSRSACGERSASALRRSWSSPGGVGGGTTSGQPSGATPGWVGHRSELSGNPSPSLSVMGGGSQPFGPLPGS